MLVTLVFFSKKSLEQSNINEQLTFYKQMLWFPFTKTKYLNRKEMHRFTICLYYFVIVLSLFNGCRQVEGSKIRDGITKNNLLSTRSSTNFHGVSNEKTLTQDLYTASATKQEQVITKLNATKLDQVIAKLNKDPFQQWRYKSTWRQLSDLKLNSDLMSSAIQPGDPNQLKNVLLKALRGEDINLVIIGGSNSAGGKLGLDEGSLDGLFFKVFTNWWNYTFGKAINAFVKVYEVTIGGTGSYVFAYCYRTFLPKQEKIDIVLIEGSINYNTRSKAESLEQLTRQVLTEPSAPAVLYINLVSGLGHDPKTKKVFNPSCINLENFGQTELARHYAVTSFSLKEVLCRKERRRWKVAVTDFAGSDGRHIGIKAHAQVAMMMIEYVRSVFEDVLNDVSSGVYAKKITPIAQLPKLFFVKEGTEALKEPLCWTGITPDISQVSHPTLLVEIVESKGFSLKESLDDGQNSDEDVISDLRTDEQGGWCAWDSYSILKIRIYVPPIKAQCPDSRSVTIMTRTSGSGSNAKVWMDDDEEKAIYIDSKSIFGNNQLDTVATRVKPGHHVITVKTVRWGMFLLSGILVGPPDFQRRRVL